MKKILLYILLPPIISVLVYLYYEGILNPREIMIDKMVIVTPRYYNLLFGAKNFEKINIKCDKNFRCSKKFVLDKNQSMLMLSYRKIFSHDVLGIFIQNLRNEKIDDTIFHSKKNVKKIGKCVFKQIHNKKYEYEIYKKAEGFTHKISIISDENNVVQKILKELCIAKY